jgi:hypothetical protein
MLFLQDFVMNPQASSLLAGLGVGMLAFGLVIGIALWVFISLAFMKIAKRLGQSMAALAWIPWIGPLIVVYRASGMHWWPWLLIIGFFIPFLNLVASVVFAIFAIIWMWKTMEAIGRPGWWALLIALLPIIPAIGFIISLVLIGMAAWGGQSAAQKPVAKSPAKVK